MQYELDLSSGKTSQASSTPQTTPSDVFSADWWVRIPPSFLQQGSAGQTRVWLMDPRDLPLGASSMPSISAWPNDASVCSLSQILEDPATIPEKYYLSATACRGILRRAEKRGKKLPERLEAALRAVAG